MKGREIGYFQEGLKGPTDALFMAVHEKVKNIYDMRLVPVRRFPTPSRSIRFSDVPDANGRGTHVRMGHVT